MAHMMLPKVKNQGFQGAAPGEWTNANLRFLYELTGSMDVSGDNSQNGNVSSIPDVWAKPLLFKMFLFDETSQVQRQSNADSQVSRFAEAMRQRVTGEWRCLLAMLALRKVKFLSLTASQVIIDPDNGELDKVLFDMCPQEDTISSDTKWSKLYILSYNGIPFALTSPTTLVSAAADYSNDLAGMLGEPWAESTDYGVVMKDPIDGLSLKDRALLCGWIENLRKNLKENTDHDYGKLDNCLSQYVADIRAAGMSNDAYKPAEPELGLFDGVFHWLDYAANIEEISPSESSVKIRPSDGKNPEKLMLLVDIDALNRMAIQWRVEKTHLVIWSGLSANNITEDMLIDREHIGTAELDGAIWVRPEDFFTEHVFALGASDVFMNVWNPGASDRGLKENEFSVVPPLRKEILNYFTIEDIIDRFRIEFTDEGELVATFNLPFTYTDKNGQQKERSFKIEKRYSELDEEHFMMQESYPIAEIWPNVKVEGWNKYYFCYINYNSKGKADVAENNLLMTPWNHESQSVDTQGKEIDCLTNKYTVQLSDFPEALLCSVYWKSGGYSAEKVDVGLLLINPPETDYNDRDTKWRIGIDFGTSNTMLYHRVAMNSPKPLVFESNLYQLMNQTPGVRVAYMASNFIWPENKQKNGSFLSIYNVLRTTENPSDRVEPLIDGHICSLSADRNDALQVLAGRIVPNLKWDTSTRRKHQAEAYLEQVCLQSAFEAAKAGAESIIWNFSYPTAFSSTETEYFRAMTRRAVESIIKNTPFANTSKINDLQMESVATAMYFNKLSNSSGANIINGAVCLDIGAGTTDITVISSKTGSNHIIYHSSIQYAGRTMFSPIFAWLERFLQTDGVIDLSNIEDPDKRRAMLDAIMRDQCDIYMSKAAEQLLGEESEKELMEGVLQISQLAMTGLFYYVGTIMWVLKEYNLFEEDYIPDIYIGGNGSRVIHWIAGATKNYRNNVHLEVLKRAIIAGSDMEEDEEDGFDILLSEYPKIEVAAGMLYDDANKEWFNEKKILKNLYNSDDEIIHGSVIAGESFNVNGEEVDAVSFMNAYDIQDGIRLNDLPEIDNLIEIYNKKNKEKWGSLVDLTPYRKIVKKKTIGYYAKKKSEKAEKIRVEPVFITAMKYLVEAMLENLMNSTER